MTRMTKKRVEELESEIVRIVEDASGEAAEYAAEFASFMALQMVDAIASPGEQRFDRMRALGLAFAETVEEMSDQAAAAVMTRLLDVVRTIVIVLGRTAAA